MRTFLCLALLTFAAMASAAPPTDQPTDLIVLVDVSLSMIEVNAPPGVESEKLTNEVAHAKYPPSDPEGFRWDGIQFLLDIANPKDRVALILYRSDAILASAYIDPKDNGFLSVEKFRGQLKDTVRNFRTAERAAAARVLKAIKNAPKEKFQHTEEPRYAVAGTELALPDFRHGTSTLNALRLAVTQLLPQSGLDRDRQLFLFTDGIESATSDRDPFPTDAFKKDDWILRPGKSFLQTLDRRANEEKLTALAFLDATVKVELKALANPQKPTPVYAITLGANCDKVLINTLVQAVAADTNDPQRPGGAYYHADTNRELLQRLQEVGWELRQRWWIRPTSASTDNPARFRIPAGEWQEAGALIYALDGLAAIAPEKLEANLPATAELLKCDSHNYIRFGRVPTQNIDIVAHRKPEHAGLECVIGLQTQQPLLEYDQPSPRETFTPLDAIPFRVRFTPLNGEYKAEHFQLEVRLARAGDAEGKTAKTIRLRPQELGGQTVFAGDDVLDGNRSPTDGARKDVIGTWTVDVDVYVTDGPLKGAHRTLLRREITVGDYPALQAVTNAGMPEVTNTAASSPLRLRLPLRYPPANLDKLVEFKGKIDSGPNWPKDVPVAVADAKVAWSSANAAVRVNLSGAGWAGLTVDKPVTGLFYIASTPWAKEGEPGVRIPFRIQKSAFTLKAVEEGQGLRLALDPALDAAIDRSEPQSVRVWIDTDGQADEPITIVGNNLKVSMTPVEGSNSGKPWELAVTPATVPCKALGRAGRTVNAESKFGFDVRVPTGVGPGRYEGTLTIGGPGTTKVAIRLYVDLDQAVLQIMGPSGWANKSQLEFIVQRGNAVECTVRLVAHNPPKNAFPSDVKRLDEPKLPGAQMQRTLQVTSGPSKLQQTEHALSFGVESSVFEGRYESSLYLKHVLGKESKELRIPVYFKVVAHPLTAHPVVGEPRSSDGTYRLQSAGAAKATGQLKLVPQGAADGKAVQWYATAKPVLVGLGAWTDEKAASARVKLLELLATGTPKNLFSEGQAPEQRRGTTPIEKPLTVAVEVDTTDLKPGLYRYKLQFFSKPDGGKDFRDPFELPIEVLVPGRTLTAKWPDDKAGLVNQPVQLQLTITAFGTTAGSGRVILPNPDGSVRSEVAVPEPVDNIQVGGYPLPTDAVAFTVAVPLSPAFIGANRYEVQWAGNLKATPPPRLATGKPTLAPNLVEPNELLTVRIDLAPGPQPVVRMLAVPAANPAAAIPFDLRDEGGGNYSGQVRLPNFERYTLRTEAGEPKEVQPVEAVVGVNVVTARGDGTFDRDPGSFGTPSWTDKNLLQVTNKRNVPCRYVVKVRYLATPELGREVWAKPDLLAGLKEPELREFDAKRDYWALPTAEGNMAESPTKRLEGTLAPQETVAAGVEVSLSQVARDGDASHPSLQGSQEFVLEVTLIWDDDLSVVRRTVVKADTIPWVYSAGTIALIAVVVLGLAGIAVWKLYPRWRGRAKPVDETPPDDSPIDRTIAAEPEHPAPSSSGGLFD